MNILILHDTISPDARADELDALTQARVISESLHTLGHTSSADAFSWNLEASHETIRDSKADLVFNLVESVRGSGRWVYLAPAVLDAMKVPYTGSSTEPMFLTANKLLTKQLLASHGIATPRWYGPGRTKAGRHEDKRAADFSPRGPSTPTKRPNDEEGRFTVNDDRPSEIIPSRYIIKSVWEEASVGLDEDSVLWADREQALAEAIESRREQLGGDGFAEEFIEGREFNLSLLGGLNGGDPRYMQVLPPAEIDFMDYADDKPKVVGYRAKWDTDSFEFHHTPRRFDFPDEDAALLDELTNVAVECGRILGVRGYARVDFRVDRQGRPWVLEVNANPCLSPDAGFFAAAQRAGLTFEDVLRRILADAPPK